MADTEQVKSDAPAEVTYVAPDAPNLKVRIVHEGEDLLLEFKNKQIKLDHEIAQTFDKIISKSPHLRRLVRKVSLEEAEKFVKDQLAKFRPQGVNGQMTSMDLKQAMTHDNFKQRDQELRLQSNNPEQNADAVNALRKDGLELTEKAKEAPQPQKHAEPTKSGLKLLTPDS